MTDKLHVDIMMNKTFTNVYGKSLLILPCYNKMYQL